MFLALVCLAPAQTSFSQELGPPLFQDDFERQESQEATEELGNGWGTNSKKRAGGHKQVDLRDGALYIFKHATADHAVSLTHSADYQDCRVQLRFRLDDAQDDLGIDFADLGFEGVHAGHICKVFFRNTGIEIQDLKNGRMKKSYRDALKEGTVTEEARNALARYQKRVEHPIKLQTWHEIIVTIRADTLAVQLDGKGIATFSSPGMAHPSKDMIRFSARKNLWLDDLKFYAKAGPVVSASGNMPVAEEPAVKHLFVAKLLLRRLEAVDLTSTQLKQFNQLSRELRQEIDEQRERVGITKETIKARDEAFSQAKKEGLRNDALWAAVQASAKLTDAQRDVFRDTQTRYAEFKQAALAILTAEQRQALPKPKRGGDK